MFYDDKMSRTPKPMVDNTRGVLAHVDGSKPVQVYRNLHKKCLSVRQGGIVKCHTLNVLLQDCDFVVNVKGRNKVRKNKQKNVHAYVKGTLVDPRKCDDLIFVWDNINYNPYTMDGFTDENTGQLVTHAKYVDIDADPNFCQILAYCTQ